ncbi:M949_RS01915 family surface polysaccharide biosynthesis protein [Aureispira anguillae]|uniref:Lipoprotein n=1 Tax=Aureispira anguillae TaxID=2864201 RepID=A0A915YL81_9BACT|nr:hypothetical protein [Aureispira anguillae]BDS15158.1 hypothetical protein AsAng_0059420 [Aureispira anguillae]
MQLKISLTVVLLVFLCACNNDSVSNKKETAKLDAVEGLEKPSSSVAQLDKFLDLFPVVTSFDFDETLFDKHEGGVGTVIPIDMDVNILKTIHEGYDGTEDFFPNAFNYAIAKFELQPNAIWGLIVMNHELGADGRNQNYFIYTINKEGTIIHRKTVAASVSWQNGVIQEVGTLAKKQGSYQIKTLSIEADWGENDDIPYPLQGNTYTYTITAKGMIEDNAEVCFLIPNEEGLPTNNKVFPTVKMIKNELAQTPIAKDWKHYSQTKNIIAWEDANGENYVLFASQNRQENKDLTFAGKAAEKTLHACHYTIKNGQINQVWEMNDYEALCEFDLFANYIYNSVELTDLDQDGIAEICFMYSLGCISDVSSVGVKLMMYENGTKYALRGSSRISFELETTTRNQPMYTVDRAFEDAPEVFLKFAQKHWERYDVVY